MNTIFVAPKWRKVVFAALLLAVAVLLYQVGFTTPVSASGEVTQVWQNVQRSDQYTFTAAVENKLIPLATLGNIGRFSKTTTLYLEGQNNLREDELQLAIWGGGVNVLDQNAAYQMRLADGKVETRVGGEAAWQPGRDLNVGMAPGGDFLAFLDVATEISLANDRTNPDYTVYTFKIDGNAYAQRLAQVSREHLVSTGQLPASVALQVPENMQAVTGSGELWVDARGLPVRQIVTLNIPAAAGADYRTESILDVQFSNYEGTMLATLWKQPQRAFTYFVSRLNLPTAAQASFGLTASLVLMGLAVIILYPNRKTQRVLIGSLIALMLITPVVQVKAAQATRTQIDAFTARQELQAASTAAQPTFLQPVEPFVPPANLKQPDENSDSDDDGLTDGAESRLGTSALMEDSDFDTISDADEVTGFSLGGKMWYGNPIVSDSNADGALDSVEWGVDTDADNTPDLYDLDDDNDGVPDSIDLSRLVASKTDTGTPVTFTRANPLQLNLNGLNPGSYTYVDLQLRPTNPNRLWYAFNTLNWPKDEKGNMQDWDNATFFDYCVANGGTDCAMTPDDNGDIKFVPMLEVSLPNLNNLPRTSGGQLDTALLQKYGISIQPAGNGSYYAYVPLNLVEDPQTDAKVAFQAKLIYQAASSWQLQEARMVWMVNVLTETYKDAKDAQTTIRAGNGIGKNQMTMLHAYDDEFQLTGLNVHEARGVQMAIVYEDPATDIALNQDDALYQMTVGLEGSFLVNRDCDFLDNDGACIGDGKRDITIPEIARRWNHPTNSGITINQRWGIGDYLRVETYTFAHEDEALFSTGGQLATSILVNRFQGTTVTMPKLLFVQETHFRSQNIESRNLAPVAQWNNNTITFDFQTETVSAVASYNIAPYRYSTTQNIWQPVSIANYADEVRANFVANADELDEQLQTPELIQASATVDTLIVVTMTNGGSSVISTNVPQSGLITTLDGSFRSIFNPVDATDTYLRLEYQQAIQSTVNGFNNFFRYRSEHLFKPKDVITAAVLLGYKPPAPIKPPPVNAKPSQLKDFQSDILMRLDTLEKQTAGYRTKLMVVSGILLIGGVAGIIATNINVKGVRIAGEIISQVVQTGSDVLNVLQTYVDVTRKLALYDNVDDLVGAKLKAALSMQSIKNLSVKLAAIGAVIGIGVNWVMFFAFIGKFPVGSVEFYNFLATTIASALVGVITFLLSLTVIGSIVLAVFAVIDLFTLIFCKAGLKAACDFGILANFTQAIADWVYQGEVMIRMTKDAPITNIRDMNMTLTDPLKGLVAGNSIRFSADILTVVRHVNPKPSVVYHYDSFFTQEDLRSSTVRYTLAKTKQTLRPERNQMTWWWGAVYPYDVVTDLVPSPGVGWLIPTYQSKTLWQGAYWQTIISPVYEFTTPKINQGFSLWLNTGMALPRYDCWFTVCSHKTAQVPNSADLSGEFVLDILPANIDALYWWADLGTQVDRDGDGISASQDPNDTKWDTDNDGVPDLRETEYGSSLILADKDNDGLNDAEEIRHSTNPNAADTDGDGLSDALEVNGYMLTIDGKTFRMSSDPLDRDGDNDGMSDSAERRLNQLDPLLYPFHPNVFNNSPVRLYSTLSDDDRVLAVSAQTIITTTVVNALKQDSLLASGRFTSTLPAQLGGTTQARNFTLLPNGFALLTQIATAQPANETVTVTTGFAADLVPVGSTPPGNLNDIILDDLIGVTIDNDNPNPPALTLGAYIQPGTDVIIGGTASDPTSYVALVEVSVNGSAFTPATGTGLWAFPLSVPAAPTGTVIPIAVRATDAVNHTTTANFSLTIDGVQPTTTLNLSTGQTRVVRRNAEGQWVLALSGNSTDALAGIAEVSVQIGSSRAVTVTNPSGAWTLNYPFDNIAFNNDPRPTMPLTMTVTTRDTALPGGNALTQIVPFVVDMTAPTVDLRSHPDDFQLLDGMVLTGTVRDNDTAISNLEIAFLPAATVFATADTLLRLPLNDLPETLLFNNTAPAQTRMYCLDESCPTSYVPGADGTAVALDGNDLLRSFEDITIPATERSVALWFNTTCQNCGLFSLVQGDFPTIIEHNQDIFLNNGKVCVSFLTGAASRELRCSVTNTYADGAWHQVVHTLGSNGNHLYVDGTLAVSSPTTASSFTTPDAVLIGYAANAASPYLTGSLDDVVVYAGDMTADVATTLYRQWQPVTFVTEGTPLQATWAYTVPLGIEGYYQIDMRAADAIGNQNDNRGEWVQLRAPIDTKAPTFEVSVGYSGSGNAAQTLFSGTAHDTNLTTDDYAFVCALENAVLGYETDPIEFAFTQQQNDQLKTITANCTQNGYQSSQVSMFACDTFGHCAAAMPPQTVAYLGTARNTLKPTGTLPNGIERTVLSNPNSREMLIERPGKIVTDLAVDEARGKIYWGEMANGAYNQPAAIWRANLDGSNVQQIIPNLNAYAPEALQIALDPVGNKLYWAQGYQLWWANLDGTLPQVIYAVPDDPGIIGGLREYHQIGDVAVDSVNGRLIFSERRLRLERAAGINIHNQSLIVATQLNGTAPEFIAGAGSGCTYDNFYENVGYGVGAGKDPILCLEAGGGMDVESLATVNGTVYWSAGDADWSGSGVYMQPFGGTTTLIAPLELNSSYIGLRMDPLPQLYIPPAGSSVYVALGQQIVRGEAGGEFTVFSSFYDPTPAAVGAQERLNSDLTALSVIHTPQSVQSQPDLSVAMNSPTLVMLNGKSARYDVTVRNHSGVPADSTTLALNLPTGATFAASDGSCSAAGLLVTCNYGRFAAFDIQKTSITFTINVSDVVQLHTTAVVSSFVADTNPNDNRVTNTAITAAPTLAALPGVPYVYYSELSNLVRVPLLGDPNPEPIFYDNNGFGGAVFAVDNVRGYVFMVNSANKVVRVALDGTGYTVIGDANPGNIPTQDAALSVAVDTVTGRVYWMEVVTMIYNRIRSANNDGSDVQTVVPLVYGQQGMLFDPLRSLLYWVGLDSQQRQFTIYRANPDGSNPQPVYNAPEGALIRDLALDPYAQKLYWLDGATDDGTLFWADSDGGNLAALDAYIGINARGVVVLPQQNTIYYTKWNSLWQAELDGSNPTEVVWLGKQRYYGVSNRDPLVYPNYLINPPQSNLAYGLSTPFAPSPCVAADGYEPLGSQYNDSANTATALTVGTYTAALCRSTSEPLGVDQDHYQIVVPAGQAVTATLSALPADYELYIRNGDYTVDTSFQTGTAIEQVIASNNFTNTITYTLAVFSRVLANNPTPYQLHIEIGVAPFNGYTSAQCLAVDPLDAPGDLGNHTLANATPITIDASVTGALCYENDSDFYTFNATAGQVIALNLPVRPADYSLLLYAPDGTFREAFTAPNYGQQVALDTTGAWSVLVRDNTLVPTNQTYQLFVTDLSCSLNDAYEPNNVAVQAADVTGDSRVFASLCANTDLDFYTFESAANQQLTVNYPVNTTNAVITLLGADGELGRIDPGSRAQFALSDAGWYTFTVGNSSLNGSNAPYMFQWQVTAPTAPITGTPYIYYTDASHVTRVALSDDHSVEPLLLEGGATTWDTLAIDATRGWLYFFDIITQAIMRFDLYGMNPQTIIANANPDGVSVPHVAIAIDDDSGRIYWLQPTGASGSNASFIMRSNGDGSGTTQIVGSGVYRDSLIVDSIQGYLYWTENDTIRRSDLDGNDATILYTVSGGEEIRGLALDPYAQKLYWLDPAQGKLMRADTDGSDATPLSTGLDASVRGLVVQSFTNALYYSNGAAMMRAQLDGTGAVVIAALSGQYGGPSNLNPNAFLNTPIGTPNSNLAFGYDAPIISPCALADGNEPNNTIGAGTPLSVITETVAYGALCNTTLPNPTDQDYYQVTLTDQKVLTVTLSQLSADYRVIVLDESGLSAAFSDNAGLADEQGVVQNSSGAPVTFGILVMSGVPVQNTAPYKLTLTLGNVPPPPDPDDAACYFADPYDTPAPGGNGSIGTATDLPLDIPLTAALCYSGDVDMYGFDGRNGQTLTIDLPIHPENYTLTLYNPAGNAWATPSYGNQVTLDDNGRWTIAVSGATTATTAPYQLLVTDENCLSSDANEPNDTTLSASSRVRASLCSDEDVDLYRVWATTGQQLTVNYPANLTGAEVAISGLGTVTDGTQGQFAIAATGWYTLSVANNSLSQRAVPYHFQIALGDPPLPTSVSPYIYYSNASDLTRVAVITHTIEPILMGDGSIGGKTIAADQTRGKLYLLDYTERIVRTNFDGTGFEVIIPDADPNDVFRFANGLALDEITGRIYWMQPQFGVVSNLMSANGDGSDVQTVISNIVGEQALVVDPVGGWLYWVEDVLRMVIKRANLDGSDVTTIYQAPEGRAIQDLTVDSYAQKLYWFDPTLNQLLWADSDGSDAEVLTASLVNPMRGLVVRPLQNELYYTSGPSLLQAELDGSNPSELARLEGSYYGISNLEPNVFYLTGFSTPSSNLALGWGTPFAQPCSDSYEPNNTPATAASIAAGTIQSVLCTSLATQPDLQDYFRVSVPDGQQLDVTLGDLPQNYGLGLFLNGTWVDSSYLPGLVDEMVTAVNETGTTADYTILVERFGDTNSSNIPYTLTVAIGDAPPPPPLPAPPGDPCIAVDPYDAPGALGNGSQGNPTSITFNTPITAALCYNNDVDYYRFNGTIGQNVTIDMPTRPADYYIAFYRPDGSYHQGIFPGSGLTYGDSVTLNQSGDWKAAIWQPGLVPTLDQYQLLFSVNTACSGLDPYEPNEQSYGSYPYDFGAAPPTTISAMLCEVDDFDYFSFDVTAGQRVRLNPRILTPGMEMLVESPGSDFWFTTEPSDHVVRESGKLIVGIYSQENIENLAYEIDIQVDAPPTPTPLPVNWACTTYSSGSLNATLQNFATNGFNIMVPATGSVTHVGLRDIILDGNTDIWGLNFGLAAPDGTVVNLFEFFNTAAWCGGTDCWFSLDDSAIPGLLPPNFPDNGGTFQPNLGSFAPFNGGTSQGNWTFLISVNASVEEGSFNGTLNSWGLEVCTDNGIPTTPPPTPTPTTTPTPVPTPIHGTPVPPAATATSTPAPTPTPASCVAPADDFEADDNPAAAQLFNHANRTSGIRTFHTILDQDWMQFRAIAGMQFHFDANRVGSQAAVKLSLYESDGITQIDSASNSLVFLPTVSGDYYLMAQSAAGIVSSCNSSYVVALTVENPAATPVPAPIGTPVPPEHNRTQVSSAILSPMSGVVLTTTAPITVEVGLAADSGIDTAALRVNGAIVDTYSASPAAQNAVWQLLWSPVSSGVYTLTADITASSALTATSPAMVVYVDTAPPTVNLTVETITLATLRPDGVYGLRGTTSDDSAVIRVEVQIDGGAWQKAALNAENWLFELVPLEQINPNGGTLTVNVRATDAAGRVSITSANFTLDVVAPAAFTFSTSLTSGETISPTQITTALNSRITWQAITDAAQVYVGWSDIPTPTLAALTAYGAGTGWQDTLQAEAAMRYAHVVAVDANGNQTAVTRGPFYFDTAQTPDLVNDLTPQNWTDSGGKQVGQMNATIFGTQKLFAGWNATALRLRWQGMNVDGDGDLYFYLSTGGSGTTNLLNPFGADLPAVLPFSADYVVHVSGSTTATLYTVNNGVWTAGNPVTVTTANAQTDILLPFGDLGIANPATANLKLLGVASPEGALAPWATAPDKNLGQPAWTQYLQWAALGSGFVPANGLWADAQMEVSVTADPSLTSLIGAGDTITLTLNYSNTGTAALPQLTFSGVGSGGIALTNTLQTALNIAPASTGSLTLLGTVLGNGTVSLSLADSYHLPYALNTFTYTLDNTAPQTVTVNLKYAGAFTNTIRVSAQDLSLISGVEVEINDGLLNRLNGTQIITCAPGNGTAEAFVCNWNAGSVSDGHSYTVRARATDVHGNTSAWSAPVTVIGDAVSPVLTLSANALNALSDGTLNQDEVLLDGKLVDARKSVSVQACITQTILSSDVNTCTTSNVLNDDTWSLTLPGSYNGITATLSVLGFDGASNSSNLFTQTVWLDTVSPVISETLDIGYLQRIPGAAVMFNDGIAIDASELTTVTAVMLMPDGSSALMNGIVSANTWQVFYEFTQDGIHEAVLILTDGAGNRTVSNTWQFNVGTTPNAVTLESFSARVGVLSVWLLVVWLLMFGCGGWLIARRRKL